MKPITVNASLSRVVAIVLLVAGYQQVVCAEETTRTWQPVSSWDWGHPHGFDVSSHRRPLSYNLTLLSLGRTVYAELQSARQAVFNKDKMNLVVDLQQARETLRQLQMPAEVIALDAQLNVIQNDLSDRSKSLDADLWVPIEAEIDDVLVYVPEDVKTSTHQAVAKARTAAGKGDRGTVSKQFDVVTSSLEYSLGMFPLYKVSRDVDAAWRSARLPEPDWAGSLEAIQSAMASMHWYTRVPIHGLLAAYDAVVNAYVLAIDPQVRPDQQQQLQDYLSRAARELSMKGGSRQLAAEATALIGKSSPPTKDMKQLLNDIQSRIKHDWQQAESRYLDTIDVE
jgi:hypothetical protein